MAKRTKSAIAEEVKNLLKSVHLDAVSNTDNNAGVFGPEVAEAMTMQRVQIALLAVIIELLTNIRDTE